MTESIDPNIIASMNVPEIGKKIDAIPVDKVLDAMQTLEKELHEYYEKLLEEARADAQHWNMVAVELADKLESLEGPQ